MNYLMPRVRSQPTQSLISPNSVETQSPRIDDWKCRRSFTSPMKRSDMPPQTSQYSIPGVVTEGDVEKTRTKLERIQDAQQEAIARQSEISQRMLSNRRRIRVNEWLVRFRKFGDDWMTRTGFLFPLVLVGSIVLLPLTVGLIAAILELVPGRALSWIISVIVFSSIPVALTVALRRALFVPDDDRLLSQVSQMHSELQALSSEQVTLEGSAQASDSRP